MTGSLCLSPNRNGALDVKYRYITSHSGHCSPLAEVPGAIQDNRTQLKSMNIKESVK